VALAGVPVEAVEKPAARGPDVPEALPGLSEVMDRAGGENFPVASRLLGPRLRGSLLAIYGFARLVDQVGDDAEGDRVELLDWLDAEIDAIYAGGTPRHPAIARMAVVARESGIPAEPLHRLVQANRADQTVRSYATFADLLGYCELSANPVGRMVLHVFGAATPDRIALSDAICSGLQVTEHLQDVREDLARGRVYLPQEDLARFDCDEVDLARVPSPERVRTLVAFEVERARGLLGKGAPLIATLRGRARLAVTAFVAGGRAALAGIERGGFALHATPPRPSAAQRLTALAKTVRAPR
jgi:squalene synthase HpnC